MNIHVKNRRLKQEAIANSVTSHIHCCNSLLRVTSDDNSGFQRIIARLVGDIRKYDHIPIIQDFYLKNFISILFTIYKCINNGTSEHLLQSHLSDTNIGNFLAPLATYITVLFVVKMPTTSPPLSLYLSPSISLSPCVRVLACVCVRTCMCVHVCVCVCVCAHHI